VFKYRAHPRRCDFFGRVDRGSRIVRDIRTRGLSWQRWGSARAEGKGYDSTGGRIAKIVAYNRVFCGGKTYYRLVDIQRPSGRTYRLRLARCGQRRFT
jgi:hypothetical protein